MDILKHELTSENFEYIKKNILKFLKEQKNFSNQ